MRIITLGPQSTLKTWALMIHRAHSLSDKVGSGLNLKDSPFTVLVEEEMRSASTEMPININY